MVESVFIAIIAGVFIAAGWLMVSKLRESNRRKLGRKLGEEMLRRAKKIGVLLYTNSASNVFALCLAGDLIDALERYKRMVREGKGKPWDRVLLFAEDTFTFWQSEDAQNLMHVGSVDDAREIIHEIIEKATGIKLTAVDDSIYHRQIYPALVKQDKRLFVPFSGNVPNAEWQEGFYGRERPEDAKAYLLDSVPSYSG